MHNDSSMAHEIADQVRNDGSRYNVFIKHNSLTLYINKTTHSHQKESLRATDPQSPTRNDTLTTQRVGTKDWEIADQVRNDSSQSSVLKKRCFRRSLTQAPPIIRHTPTKGSHCGRQTRNLRHYTTHSGKSTMHNDSSMAHEIADQVRNDGAR